VAGSPAVLNALRLVFVIERSADNPEIRLITRHKSNISGALPQAYTVTGAGPSTRAQFTDAGDSRAERVRQAARPALRPDAGESVRSRMAAQPPADGPYRLLRQVQAPGKPRGAHERLGGEHATRDAAKALALADAAGVLVWQPAAGVPGMETAGLARADGSKASYAVFPASRPANSDKSAVGSS
jgi:hypothetical protein